MKPALSMPNRIPDVSRNTLVVESTPEGDKTMGMKLMEALRELATEHDLKGRWLRLDVHFKVDGDEVLMDEGRIEEVRTTIVEVASK